MAYLLQDAYSWYRDVLDNRSDPRVKDWAMMESPLPTMAMCAFYVYFSKSLGPKLMASRPALNLRWVLVLYNLAQTLFSTWLFYEYLMSGWLTDYSFKCQPVDYSNSPQALRMANICWWFYIAKFTEFIDTLFFILRKKTEHVSTLHVIHHGCMPFSVWMGLKIAPGGHSTFFAMLNSFVHIVMYFYYMVSAMGPRYQKFIWWKKYLTTFQMVQFVAIFTHQFQLLFRECDYPNAFMVWIGLHGVMFLFLFGDFYKTKYTPASKKSGKVTANGSRNGSKAVANGSGGSSSSTTTTANSNGTSAKRTNTGICMPVLGENEFAAQQQKNGNGHSNGFIKAAAANGSVLTNGGSNGLRSRKLQ